MTGPGEGKEEAEFDPMQVIQEFVDAGRVAAEERFGEFPGRTLRGYLMPYPGEKIEHPKNSLRGVSGKRCQYIQYLVGITKRLGQDDVVDACLVHDLRAYKAKCSDGIVNFYDGRATSGEIDLMAGALSVVGILDDFDGRIAKELDDIPVSKMLKAINPCYHTAKSFHFVRSLSTILEIAIQRHGVDSEDYNQVLRDLSYAFCNGNLAKVIHTIKPEWMGGIMGYITQFCDEHIDRLYSNLDYYLTRGNLQIATKLREFPELMKFYEDRKAALEEKARVEEEAERVATEQAKIAEKAAQALEEASRAERRAKYVEKKSVILDASISKLLDLTVVLDESRLKENLFSHDSLSLIHLPEEILKLGRGSEMRPYADKSFISIANMDLFAANVRTEYGRYPELLEKAELFADIYGSVKPRLIEELSTTIFENREKLWENYRTYLDLDGVPKGLDLDSFYDEDYHGAVKGERPGNRDHMDVDYYFDERIRELKDRLEYAEQYEAFSSQKQLEKPEYSRSAAFFMEKHEAYKQELRAAIEESEHKRVEVKKKIGLHRARGIYTGALKKIDKSRNRAEKRGGYSESLEIKHILRTAEAQTEYLVNLFSAATGLKFSAAATVRPKDKGVVGYVRIVEIGEQNITVDILGIQLLQRLKLVQKLMLEMRPENHIHLELGEDIDSMRMRIPMADFLAAHEASHIVDACVAMRENRRRPDGSPKLEYYSDLVTHNYANEANRAADEMPFDKDECLNHLGHVMGEAYIDGMAVRLLRDAGTTNLEDDTMSKRLNTTFSSMAATLRVIGIVTQRNLENGTYMLPYFFHLVRNIAGASQLLAVAEVNGTNIEVSRREELEDVVAKLELQLEAVILALATTDGKVAPEKMISPEIVQDIAAICASMFNEAEKVDFDKIGNV